MFKMSTVAERSKTKASTKNTHWETCTKVSRFFMYWAGDVTAFHVRLVAWNCCDDRRSFTRIVEDAPDTTTGWSEVTSRPNRR